MKTISNPRALDHNVFLEEVYQWMNDFDIPFEEAANLVHESWTETNMPNMMHNYQEYLNSSGE